MVQSQKHLFKMETRSDQEAVRDQEKRTKQKQCSTPEGKEKQREAEKRARRKRRMENEWRDEEVEILKRKLIKKHNKIVQLTHVLKEKENQISFLGKCLDEIKEKDCEKLVAEENDEITITNEVTTKAEETVQNLLENDQNYKSLLNLTKEEFDQVLLESNEQLKNTTFRGTQRKQSTQANSQHSIQTMLFLTLFWLANYPTLNLMGAIFHLHQRTITQILKRTLVGLKQVFQNEIHWPTDEEFSMDLNNFTFFQNSDFSNVACVVDGTEIRVSRPSKEPLQHQLYSGKKKQHSLNVLILTKLNGEIIFFSHARIGAHDQSHWNELNLRETFINKHFGIMGDGGFTFNRKTDSVQINGYKPFKTPRNSALTPEQKKYNKHLSQMRVVVENTIARVKQWKIMKGVFRHFRNGKGKLDINHILTAKSKSIQFEVANG